MTDTGQFANDKCFAEALQVAKDLVDKYPVDFRSTVPSNYRLSADTLIGLVAHDRYKDCLTR